jgi:hypothetical protein
MRECRGRRLTGQRQTGAHELKRLSPFGATATTTLSSRDPDVHRPFGRFVAAFDPLVPAPRAAWLRIAAVRGEVMTPGVFDPKKGTGRPRLCAGEVRKHTRTLRSRGIKGRSDPGLGRSLHFKVLLVVGDVKRLLASLPRSRGRQESDFCAAAFSTSPQACSTRTRAPRARTCRLALHSMARVGE